MTSPTPLSFSPINHIISYDCLLVLKNLILLATLPRPLVILFSVPLFPLKTIVKFHITLATLNLKTNTKKLKMIDPQLVADAFKKTTTAVLPFPPPTSTYVAPIPTVIPDVPRFEKIGDAGHKTLWVRQTPYVYTNIDCAMC